MKLNQTLILLILFFAFQSNAQFKRTFSHHNEGRHFFSNYIQPVQNDLSDLLVAEIKPNNNVLLSISAIDDSGELKKSTKKTFNITGVTFNGLYISGVFDDNQERTICFDLVSNSSKSIYVVKYNKATGVELEHHLYTTKFKNSFVKSIKNGDEIVCYAVKNTGGGLYRIGFKTSSLSATSEELVNANIANIGATSSANLGRKSGQVTLFNGKEIGTFTHGSKSIYVRNGVNSYTNHPLNNKTSGITNVLVLNNQRLLVSNEGEFFELDQNFAVVKTRSQIKLSSAAPRSSEVETINDKIYHFFRVLPSNIIQLGVYDINLNALDSLSYNAVTLVDLVKYKNGLLLSATNYQETQVNFAPDGTALTTNLPVFLDYFTNTPSNKPTLEYQFPVKINDLSVRFGLGNELFPGSSGGLPSVQYADSIPVAYTISTAYIGSNQTDTLGKNSSCFFPAFLPGPYTTSGVYTDVVASQYNRGFFVTKQMIIDHLDALRSNNPTYVAPHGIKNWPAHGDVALGQASILAPFVDNNNNGQYEPFLGDYPSIFGDNCLFSITHDNPNIAKSANIETHTYAYWFNSTAPKTFQNTVFQKSMYFSRISDYDNFNIGTEADIDLGNFLDDYVGTHAEIGLVYTYNGDLVDEDVNGRKGFGTRLPATGVLVLKGSKQANDSIDNPNGISQNGSVNGYGFGDGIIDNEFLGLEHSYSFNSTGIVVADPNNYTKWNNLLNGYIPNQDTLRYGAGGYLPQSTNIAAKFMFPDESDILNYGTYGIDPTYAWSERKPSGASSSSNAPGDRRFLAATGKQRLHTSDTMTYDIAFVFSIGEGDVPDINNPIGDLANKCVKIKNCFESNSGDCEVTFDPIRKDLAVSKQSISDVSIYPNPTSKTIKFHGLKSPNAQISVFDVNGRLLLNAEISSAHNEVSLSDLEGTLFIVKIQDGTSVYTKRVIKY